MRALNPVARNAMASKIAKTVASAVGQVGAKQTLGDALKLGGAHVILDGNLGCEAWGCPGGVW